MSAEHARLQRRLEEFRALESDLDDLDELEEMAAEDESIAAELEEQRASIEARLAALEEERLFAGRYDSGDAVVTVHAGAGRHRLAGLGRDAAAHGAALGRAARHEDRD